MMAVIFAVPNTAAAFSLPSLQAPRLQEVGAAVLGSQSICLKLGSLDSSIATRIKAGNAAYEKDMLAREARVIATLASKNTTLSARSDADTKLAAYLRSINAKAGGDVLKEQAVAVFAGEVRRATEARRKAIDAATQTYRIGVAEASRQRINEVIALGENLRADLSATVASASSRCRGGTDGQVVRDELARALANIERVYRGKLADKSALTSRLAALTEARTKAIVAADAEFTASLNASSQALRSVLQ